MKTTDWTAKKINTLHRSITTYKKITLEAMVEIGKLLYDQKRIYDGTFTHWMEKNLEFSGSTANKYMRVYRLVKTDWYNYEQSPSENLATMSDPKSYKQYQKHVKAEEIAKDQKIKLTTAKTLLRTMEKIPSLKIDTTPEIKFINSLNEDQKTKIRLIVFKAMERAYDLGRRNKILSINEKRDQYDKIVKVVEK